MGETAVATSDGKIELAVGICRQRTSLDQAIHIAELLAAGPGSHTFAIGLAVAGIAAVATGGRSAGSTV